MNDLDAEAPQYRWPMMKGRLDRALIELQDNLNRAAESTGGTSEVGLPQAMTIRGTPYTSYVTGVVHPEGAAPFVIKWDSDEKLVEDWDGYHQYLYETLYRQIRDLAPCRLTWRIAPYTGVHWPPTEEELLAGMRTYNNKPVVWSRFRLALEKIEYEAE